MAPTLVKTMIAESVIQQLSERGLRLATAESTVGGLIGHLLTDVHGASRVFPGGIVAYANTAKHALLNVPETILESHGSVSKETALAMAYGARSAFGADLAVAETGIASALPSGRNSAERPPGLYFVALVADGYEQVDRCIFPGNREETKFQAAELALRLVLNYLGDADRN